MKLLDGKVIAEQVKAELAVAVQEMKSAGHRAPHLAAILVGHDGASETYVASKVKSCKEIGFGSTLVRFPSDVSQEELMAAVEQINNDDQIDGVIVQLPLPKHIDEQQVIEAVHPSKDVDGFHPENVGRLVLSMPTFVSATPAGIMELLKRYGIETAGKHCVVLGRIEPAGQA